MIGVCGVACYVLEDWEAEGSEQNQDRVSAAGPAFSDPLLLGRPHISKVAQLPETVLPAGDQRFK